VSPGKENKLSVREILQVIFVMGGIGLGFFLIKVAVVLVIAWLLSMFLDVSFLTTAIVAFLAISFVMALLDLLGEDSETRGTVRCPQCDKKIKTSLPVKCVECGGAALLREN